MNVYREFSENNSMQDILTLFIKRRLEEVLGCSLNDPMIELNQLRIGDSIVN